MHRTFHQAQGLVHTAANGAVQNADVAQDTLSVRDAGG